MTTERGPHVISENDWRSYVVVGVGDHHAAVGADLEGNLYCAVHQARECADIDLVRDHENPRCRTCGQRRNATAESENVCEDCGRRG